MPVDARRRYELYVAFEPLLGDTTAAFMEMLREVAEQPELQRWNYDRFRRQPEPPAREDVRALHRVAADGRR